MPTWDEIIEQILVAKKRGHPYRIPIEELAPAVPRQFARKGIRNPIDALNHVLAAHNLRAEFEKTGYYVTVSSE